MPDIPTTMRAGVVHEFGKPLVIEAVPVPKPGPGEMLVNVMACGVCHTDLNAADGDWPVKPTPPFIQGPRGCLRGRRARAGRDRIRRRRRGRRAVAA